jgi:hypothetical protein
MVFGFIQLVFLTLVGMGAGRFLSHSEFGWVFGGLVFFVIGLFRFDGHK